MYRFVTLPFPSTASVTTASASRTVASVLALRNIDPTTPFAGPTVANHRFHAGGNRVSMANSANALALTIIASAHDEGTVAYTDFLGEYDEFRTIGGHTSPAYDVSLAMGLTEINGVSFTPGSLSQAFGAPTDSYQQSFTHQDIILTA